MSVRFRLKYEPSFKEDSSSKMSEPEVLRKFNIRVHENDLELIKRLAELCGVSRAQAINTIIENVIFDFLNNLGREECSLLIQTADEINGVSAWDTPEKSWFSNIYSGSIQHDLNNDINCHPLSDLSSRSDFFMHLHGLIGKALPVLQKTKDAQEEAI